MVSLDTSIYLVSSPPVFEMAVFQHKECVCSCRLWSLTRSCVSMWYHRCSGGRMSFCMSSWWRTSVTRSVVGGSAPSGGCEHGSTLCQSTSLGGNTVWPLWKWPFQTTDPCCITGPSLEVMSPSCHRPKIRGQETNYYSRLSCHCSGVCVQMFVFVLKTINNNCPAGIGPCVRALCGTDWYGGITEGWET